MSSTELSTGFVDKPVIATLDKELEFIHYPPSQAA